LKFASASRDELWIDGVRIESRLSHGVAVDEDNRIVARDDYDEELVHRCDELIADLRKSVRDDARMRLFASARRVRDVVMSDATITGAMSLDQSPIKPGLPILWRNGSASVLLHEAIGHAAEHNAPPVAWPSWLSVRDEPTFPLDDCGNETRAVDLMREPPSAFRRESFRDVPLRRMSNVVVRGNHAFDSCECAEVFVVGGGAYDPLTDIVTIDLGTFTLRKTRAEIAASIIGARGEPQRYPALICSREGQEIVVGSHAPEMLTR